MRSRFQSVPVRIPWILACLVATCLAPCQEVPRPDEIADLEAWYRVESLQGRLGEKNSVDVWPDASPAKHDLHRVGDDRPATYREDQVQGRSVVEVETGDMSVDSPFTLEDHTVFIVARSKYSDPALFRAGDEPSRGIVLFQDGRHHVARTGGVGTSSYSYTDPIQRPRDFTLITLARHDGLLRAWADGADVSSWGRFDEPLTVAAFFNLRMSQFVDRDARGLQVAEMIFYRRFLDGEERGAVTAYLAERFGIRLLASGPLSLTERMQRLTATKSIELAWMRTADAGNLNEAAGHRIVWSGATRKSDAFAHEPGEQGSRIRCTRDGLRARVFLALPVVTETPGAALRALVLKNGSEYLPGDAVTGPIGVAGSTNLELETTVELDADDYIELVTFPDGAAGMVRIGPDPIGLVLEPR